MALCLKIMPTLSIQSFCKPSSSSKLVYEEGYWKYGRYYGAWRDSYQFPIDAEELRRLDMLNKFFFLARGDQAFSCPVRRGSPTRVLDLVTGTGIWAIQVAEDILPDSHVMAVDLNRIQPAFIPLNLTVMQFNIEDKNWAPLLTNCDLVHMRLLLGSIHNDSWPATYQKAFEHTTPGGYIEQVEINWAPRWESAYIPEGSALLEWSQKFLQGMDDFHRSARISSPKAQRMVEAAGYVDFKETTIRCCVSPWCDDTRERLVANWFNIYLIEGIEAKWKNAV